MIIKKVAISNTQLSTPRPTQQKGTTPRIMIKIKKNLKLMEKNQSITIQEKQQETSNVYQTDYFSDQFRLRKFQKIDMRLRNTKTIEEPMNIKCQTIKQYPKDRLSRQSNEVGIFDHNSFQAINQNLIQNTLPARLLYPDIHFSEENAKKLSSKSKKNNLIIPMVENSKSQLKDTSNPFKNSDLDEMREFARFHIHFSNENKSCVQVNPYTQKQYLHKRISQSSNQKRPKKFNSLDYSIIKPNQIVPVPLSQRNYDKLTILRRKNERKHFPELIAALKRKQQLRAEREKPKQYIKAEFRSNIHTSYINRLNKKIVSQKKDQLVPWQIQNSSNILEFI